MFIFNIEYFLNDIRGPRYQHLKKVYFFVGHLVSGSKETPQTLYPRPPLPHPLLTSEVYLLVCCVVS